MPYDIIFMTTVLPTLLAVGGGVSVVWIVTRAFLQYKRAPSSPEWAAIADSIESLHHTVEDLRDDVREQIRETRELSGRVAIAERLLTKAADNPGLEAHGE